MHIIIPMAGIGKRMRPHTLTQPKPLFPIAGKAMVRHIVEMISSSTGEPVHEIAFVIGPPGGIFGKETEERLMEIAHNAGSAGKIYYQQEPLGTAHAILAASASLKENVFIAFADTLFRGKITIEPAVDGIIWVKKVDDPRPFGVVKTGNDKIITGFIEKSPLFVSDLAIIGLYYFRDGENLRKELQFLVDNNIRDKGEYQLTNGLENMKFNGVRFKAQEIDEWLDCGNKDNTLQTHRRMLEAVPSLTVIPDNIVNEDSKIIPPCNIGKNVKIIRSSIGPFVSAGDNSVIRDSAITNSIILNESSIIESHLNNSIVGNHVYLKGDEERKMEVNLGDYSAIF